MKLETVLIFLCAFILTWSSCAKRKTDSSNGEDKTETSSVQITIDKSDPNAVAHTAWQAIVEEDFDTYMTLVHPDSRQRETRKQWSDSIQKMKELQGFSTKPKLNIISLEGKYRAAAVTDDLRMGIGMVYKNDQWWID